jgi:hypothetical protein
MIRLRPAVAAFLAAAAVAGWVTYFLAPPARIEANQELPATVPISTGRADTKAFANYDQLSGAEKKAAEAYLEAAKAILRRAPNVQASIGSDEPPITGPVPLPKRRPVIAP